MYEKRKYSRAATLREAKLVRVKRTKAGLFAIALAGVIAAGGTIAFIVTTSSTVENTFEPTSVSCAVNETVSGGVKSEVSVENTGTTDAFIRAEIVANWVKLDENDEVVSVLGIAPVLNDDYTIAYGESNNWTAEMDDGYYYYLSKVSPEGKTGILISSCAPKASASVDGYVLRVDIIAEAIQADGSDGGATPVDSWDNDKVDVTRNGDSISVTAKPSADN